ncbi:sterol carrier protein 2 [Moniliophthora roreri]|nr:sterol carrier protein 2 [Moniliophthora roreri]
MNTTVLQGSRVILNPDSFSHCGELGSRELFGELCGLTLGRSTSAGNA